MVNNLISEKELSAKIGKSPNIKGHDRETSYLIFNDLKCPECGHNTAFLSVEIMDDYPGRPINIVGCSTKNCVFRTELVKNMEKLLYSLDLSWDQYISKYQK